MVATSTMLPLGTTAPAFSLPSTDGPTLALEDLAGTPALLVAFLCNHCPYVRHVQEGFAALASEYQDRGVMVVGIASNDWERYPDDAPARLAAQKDVAGFTFPYLIDESQEVAKTHRAACTPDFYVFGADRALAYRGRMDGSRPGSGIPVTGEDLRAALDAVLAGQPVPGEQYPSMGCSIKWRPGNDPGA